MAIQFNCPYCTAAIQVPDASAGKLGRCPKCETRLRIPSIAPPEPAAPAPPAAAVPPPQPPAPTTANPARPLLLDTSAVFVMPPQEPAIAPPAPPPSWEAAPPPAPTAAPPQVLGKPETPAPADLEAARAEFAEGQQNLNRPYVPGTGWPAADRAVQHFSTAARLDPGNADYATHAGRACQSSIQRFLESWDSGPLVMIAAFQIEHPLGQQIDRQEEIFRPTKLTPENLRMLLTRANEALEWFQRALEIDPQDAVARCYRAELLRNVGAFGPALADVRQVLASPLVPTSTRDQAQQVADFILAEDSPLRTYLTRTEAQQQSPPKGLKLPVSTPAPAPAIPAPAPPVVTAHAGAFNSPGWNLPPTDEFPLIHPEGRPPAPAIADLPPTAAEMPFVVQPRPDATGTPSVTARLKQRRSGNWLKVATPILCGLILIGLGVGYMIMTRPTFRAELVGEDVGGMTLRKTFFENQFNLPHDRFERLIGDFRDDPRTLPTQFRSVQLTGKPQGLEVSLRAGEGGRLVRVDLRSHPYLAEFVRKHAAEFEAPQAETAAAALTSFGKDYDTSRNAGMQMGNLGSYLESLGGDLLVAGLGYHVVARVDDLYFPCCYEDANGWLYFLVPKAAQSFTVVERDFGGDKHLFPSPVEYQVTIQAPAPAAAPAASAPSPDASTPEPGPAAR